MSTKRARIEDAQENHVNYVTVKADYPRLIRDPVSGKTYEAKLDDFCCFDRYREVKVTTVEFEDSSGKGPADRAAMRIMESVTDKSDPSVWRWSDRKLKWVEWEQMIARIIREEMAR